MAKVNATTLRNERGEVDSLILVVQDITERKQAEDEIRALNRELDQRVRERTAELEASNRELESFAYSVSHDLRAPLRAIDGFSQALLEDCCDHLDARGRDYLDRVSAAARRMARLIDDLLEISRVTRKNMRRQRVNLTTLAREIEGQLRADRPERDVTFVIPEGLEVVGDPMLLRLALENLFNNAFKFTANRPRALIEFGAQEQNGKTTYFISDDGVGFDMAYADKLFVPFQRLHNRSQFPGTGIGLATVQRIVHRHGGRVWGEGRVDRGATFYFTLTTPSGPL
jgi:light-regulated signal transduction histidine kinase (bacteriophytochrome)